MLPRRTSPRRAPLRARTRAELERDAVTSAIAAVATEAEARPRPQTTRERNQCEGYSRALEDLSREVRERLEALDRAGAGPR